jgi:hypothetical protein
MVGRQKVSPTPSYNAKVVEMSSTLSQIPGVNQVGRPAIRECSRKVSECVACLPRNRLPYLIKRRVIKRRGGLAALWSVANKIG